MILERLVGGEWECALKLLELPEQDQWQEWQSSVQRGISPNRMRDIDFMDVTGMRQKLTNEFHCPFATRTSIRYRKTTTRGRQREMRSHSTRTVGGRIRKLEIQFGAAMEAMRHADVPSGQSRSQNGSPASGSSPVRTRAWPRRQRGRSESAAGSYGAELHRRAAGIAGPR